MIKHLILTDGGERRDAGGWLKDGVGWGLGVEDQALWPTRSIVVTARVCHIVSDIPGPLPGFGAYSVGGAGL